MHSEGRRHSLRHGHQATPLSKKYPGHVDLPSVYPIMWRMTGVQPLEAQINTMTKTYRLARLLEALSHWLRHRKSSNP
jgi:hypothetical protein